MAPTSHLRQSLGLRLVIVVVTSNIIGSGVYKKVAPMAAELHSSGWIIICWILSGLITLFGALSNAEVAGLLAGTGGEYVYYKKIYNRFFAFLFGWSLFTVIQTAAISSLAYVFAQSLHSIIQLADLLPHMADYNIGGVFYPFLDLNVKITAIILIIILTWLNTKGIKMGTGVSTYDRKHISEIIEESDHKNYANSYLVSVCEFGATLGHLFNGMEGFG